MKVPSLDKLPPRDNEAEQSVLGACIHSGDAFYKAAEIITENDFYKSSHKQIFSCMQRWFSNNRGINIDVITLADCLKEKNLLEKVGGIEYLGLIEDYVPTSTAVMHHSKIVKNKSVKRAVIEMSEAVLEKAYQDDLSAEELLVHVNSEALKIDASDNEGIKDYNSIMAETIKGLDFPWGRGLPTGFSSIDSMTGGMHPGETIILAARPGMGKSSLAMDIAENVAAQEAAVGIFSLEMSTQEIGEKRLLREAGLNTSKIRFNNLQKEDYAKLHDAALRTKDLPIYIEDTASMTLSLIYSKAMRMKREWNIKLLIIDYLHLVSTHSSGGRSRNDDVSELSRGIKILAKDLNIPVLLLSQLNRACEDRPDKRPQLRDLRESGSIEQDADMVWFIYRESFYSPDEEEKKRDAELLIAKQRHGPKGTANLTFIPEMSSFQDED